MPSKYHFGWKGCYITKLTQIKLQISADVVLIQLYFVSIIREHSFFVKNSIGLFKEVTKKNESSTRDIVCMDFSKVFDKDPHGRLVQKDWAHGIQRILNWTQI